MEYQNKNDNGAFISSKLDDYLLDPFEFRIYARIVRRAGTNGCYESVNNMAKACMMSLAKARKSLHSLQDMKLITITDRSEKGLTNLCTVNSFSDWEEKRDIDSIKSAKEEDYIKKNKGLTRSEIARASKKIKEPLPDTLVPPVANMVGGGLPDTLVPPTIYAGTPLANMVDKGTPVKESTQGSPENTQERSQSSRVCVENSKTNQESNIPHTNRTPDISTQHQDMNEVQEVKYISLDENLTPNINPPSAAPLNNSQQEENSEAIAGELVVLEVETKSNNRPYDKTDEDMPASVAKGLEYVSTSKDREKFIKELQEAAKYEIGDIVCKYRKSGIILFGGRGASRDISDEFAASLIGGSVNTIAAAKSRILKCEKNPSEWSTIRGWVLEFDCRKANTSTKQVVSNFKSQEIANSPAVEILRKMRSL